jgi:hypothetical protein
VTGRSTGLVVAAALCTALLVGLWPTSARGPHLLVGWLQTTGPGFAAAATVLLAAWGPGTLLRRRILESALRDDAVAVALLDLALGLAVLQCAAVGAGAAGLFSPWLARGVILLGLCCAAAAADRSTDGSLAAEPMPLALGVGALALLLPVFLQAGAPGTAADELQYHLRFVGELIDTGTFAAHRDDPVSGLAQGLHALLGLAHGLLDARALRPLSVLLGLAGLLAGQRLVLRVAGTTASIIYVPIALGAASVLRFLPVVGTDTPLMLFLAVALLLLVEQQAERQPSDGRSALLLGLLGGAAFSIKYTAAVYFAPVWAAAVLLAWRRDLRCAALVLASALIPLAFAAPWLLKNVAMGAHPLMPLAGFAVPAGLDEAFRYALVENYGAGAGIAAWLRTPWDLFVLGTEFDRRHFLGRLSPWPLLALPFVVLALRHRGVRMLGGVSLLGLALWAGPLRRVAYLLPIWPLLAATAAAGLGLAVDSLPRRSRRQWGAVLGAALALTALAEASGPWVDGLDAAPVSTGRQSASDWVDQEVPSAGAWTWIREHVPAEEVVTVAFVWRMLPTGHAQRWACAEECTPVRLELVKAGNGEGAANRLRAMGSRWLLVQEASFQRESYPGLTDDQFEASYLLPLRVLDELTTLKATLRFSEGRYAVYELSDE